MTVYLMQKHIKFTAFLLFFSCLPTLAQVSDSLVAATDEQIEILRKRDAVIMVGDGTTPLPGVEVTLEQIRSHFGFGASVSKKEIAEQGEAYWNAFLKYFEWATPENEMKWNVIDETDDFQFWGEADSIVKWCRERNIKVRGHNLFWNERLEFQPQWALDLPPEQFKQAMHDRITSAMTHFNGKVDHWDIINEIIHMQNAVIPDTQLLAKLSGDLDVYPWILKEARKIDTTAKFCVNEYFIITPGDSHFMQYVDKIQEFLDAGAPIDIVGVEGHMYGGLYPEDYKAKLDYIGYSLEMPIWLTEVDFTVPPEEDRADRIEEFMRIAFSHPFVEGVILWVWWDGRKWKETLNSVCVDSNFVETDFGERYRTLRDMWKTNVTLTTDAEGKVSFRGFHGKYRVTVNSDAVSMPETIYLEPGEETQLFNFGVGTSHKKREAKITTLYLNGRELTLRNIDPEKEPLFLSTFTLSGKLIRKIPITVVDGFGMVSGRMSRGCHVYRIGTKEKTLYSSVELDLH